MSSKTNTTVQNTNLPSDERLIERIKAPDSTKEDKKQAFADLFERYQEKIRSYAERESFGSGNDILMAVMVEMIDKLESGKYISEGKPFYSWLKGIATNKLYEYYREAKNEVDVSFDNVLIYNFPTNDPFSDEKPSQYDETIARKLLEKVGLSDYHSKVVLEKLEGRTFKDIAEDLGRTHGAVRVAHHRAMEKVRQNRDVFRQYYQQKTGKIIE